MDYAQAIILGLIQGVTELFPVSSLGHSVILPALFGWTNVVAAQSATESFFLAFLVGLHVATALALAVFYRDQWVRIVKALIRSLRRRAIETPDERLGWLLVVATIPAGLVGLAVEHPLRVLFATPIAAAGFLQGDELLLGESKGHLDGEAALRVSAGRTLPSRNGETRRSRRYGIAEARSG